MEKPDTEQTEVVRLLTDEGGRRYAVNGSGERLSGIVHVTSGIQVGDVNGDGMINSEDAALLLIAASAQGSSGTAAVQYLLDNNTAYFGDAQTVSYSADIDRSGEVNASDAAAILIYAAAVGADPDTPPLSDDDGMSGTYFADENGYIQYGLIQDAASGSTYLADENGKLLTGWHKLTVGENSAWYFFDEDGTMAKNRWIVTNENKTVWLQEDGTIKTNSLLVLDDGTYCLGADGTMQTDVQTIEEKSYYFDRNGKLHTGLIVTGDVTYYADEEGVLQTGYINDGEDTYFFRDDFTMLESDWLTDENGVRRFDADGKLCRGWNTLNGTVYYFNADGYRQTGLLVLDGKTYLLGEDGARLTGWQDTDGRHVFFSYEDGSMVTGWQTIDGIRFFFHEDGSMAADTEIDGQRIQPNGYAMSDTLYEATLTIQEGMAAHEPTPDGIFDYIRETNRYKKIENTKTLEQLEEIGWTYLVNFATKNYYTVSYYMAAKMDYTLRLHGFTCRIVHASHDNGDHYWNQVLIGEEWVNYDPTNNLRGYTWEQMTAYGNYELVGYLEPEYK